MRNPTTEETAPILENIQRHSDLTAEAALIGAQIQHHIHTLKKSCGVPRDPLVVLDDERGIWVKVTGKTENGAPTTEPLIKTEP